jgi:hypothetical protein
MQESLVMCLNGSETMPDQGHILAKNPMNRVIYSELSPSAPVYAGVGGVGWLNRSHCGALMYGH